MNIIALLKELDTSLKVHSSVKTIFREATKQEIQEFLSVTPDEIYIDAWNSLVSKVSTLSLINYEKDENDSTRKVIRCISTLTNIIKNDSSFPKEILQTDDNKALLISVASMINLFGVNCVIYHDVSQFVNDALDML